MKSNGRSHTNIGTLDISMLTGNYGENKQHYSVVFESWKLEKLLDSGILMKDKRGQLWEGTIYVYKICDKGISVQQQ